MISFPVTLITVYLVFLGSISQPINMGSFLLTYIVYSHLFIAGPYFKIPYPQSTFHTESAVRILVQIFLLYCTESAVCSPQSSFYTDRNCIRLASSVVRTNLLAFVPWVRHSRPPTTKDLQHVPLKMTTRTSWVDISQAIRCCLTSSRSLKTMGLCSRRCRHSSGLANIFCSSLLCHCTCLRPNNLSMLARALRSVKWEICAAILFAL